jgi:hypothetical protein
MDTFLAIARRLAQLLLLLFGSGYALCSFACSAPYTEVQAKAQCQAIIDGSSDSNTATYTCPERDLGPSGDADLWAVELKRNGVAGYGAWEFCAAPKPPPCSDLTNTTSWVQGKVLVGYYTSVYDGQGNLCRVELEPVTPPMTCGSGWCTLVESNPSTTGPDSSPVTPPGSVDNANGQPAQPSVPEYPASGSSAPSNPPPTICGGGSCYDPSTGNACAVGPSGQVCVKVANASGATSGGCASSGSTTVCGGSPTPPSPVGSQGSTITDPATQIQSSDGYTSANPSTGAATGSTVNVYSSGGSTSSGATTGSLSNGAKGSTSTKNGQSGPASSSSTGGNGDSWGGGGDCNTPPVCQGDAVMCGVTLEQWRTMCSAHMDTTSLIKDVAGDEKGPSSFQSDSSKYSQSDVWQSGSGGSGNTIGDQANSGNYDSSGFGYNTSCPLQDLNVPFGSGAFVVPFSEGCVIGPWLRAVIIGFALFSAAVITAGGRG